MGGMQMGMPGGGAPMGYPPMGQPPMPFYGGQQQQQPQPMNQFTDPNNTTVFVGGLSGYVTEDELRSFFQGFGEITYVKIPPGKGCGFVQFVQRHAAEMAINQMQGYPIGNSRVRLSWVAARTTLVLPVLLTAQPLLHQSILPWAACLLLTSTAAMRR